jgi:hypothetical protein
LRGRPYCGSLIGLIRLIETEGRPFVRRTASARSLGGACLQFDRTSRR